MICPRCKRNLPEEDFSEGGPFCDDCEDELEGDSGYADEPPDDTELDDDFSIDL